MSTTEVRDRFFVSDKDPNKVYRWCNEHERNMLERQYQGFAPELGKPELNIPLSGQSTETPTGGVVRKRGDLILCSMPRAIWEENVLKPKLARQARAAVTVDTMVQQANENARRALRDKGYSGSQVPKTLVFQEDADSDIKGGQR